MATNSEKSAKYTGWHRTIQEFADELGGDSVEQPEGTVWSMVIARIRNTEWT